MMGALSLVGPPTWGIQYTFFSCRRGVSTSGGSLAYTSSTAITKHAEENKISLLREIEIVQPRIIVCGGTMKYLEKILGTKRNSKCDNWYYWFDIGNSKDVLVLDYCHPAFRSYSLLYYYGIVNIYQQALLSKDNSTKIQESL